MNLSFFGACWFAIQVKPRHERTTALLLRMKGYQDLVPLARTKGNNGERIERMLYPGYIFCRFDSSIASPIVTTPGVIRLVGNGSSPVPVSDEEIARIQLITTSGWLVQPWPYIRVGDRIRLREGPLTGLTGILLRVKNVSRLVVSVDLLCRSAAVELERSWVESAEVASCDQPASACGRLQVLPQATSAASAA